MKWTDEQLEAIERTDVGAVVPAAAGSGKTAVLVERTIRLLENDCPAEALLAVTFTKDAANQMRTKLRAALAERIVTQTDAKKRKWLEHQREMLPLAKISTINSFCLDLVNANLNEFDYRNGIKICDETQAKALFNEAAAEALEKLRADSPKNALILSDAFSGISDKELIKLMEKFHAFVCSLAFPDEWIEKTGAGFTDKEKIGVFTEVLFYELSNYADKAFKETERETAIAEKIPNGEKFVKISALDRALIMEIKYIMLAGDYKKLYDKDFDYKNLSAPSKKGLDTRQLIDMQNYYEQFKASRDRMKNSLTKIKETLALLGRDIYKPMRYAGRVFNALTKAEELLSGALYRRKLELSCAEFSDVERMAMDLLISKDHKRTPLCERIISEHTYRVMLIDEYQDVNNLQEMIFRALSDSNSPESFGRNVFVVGDVKQSIYRFRLSNPRLFINAVRAAEDESNKELKAIRLTKNFRSRQSVIDLVNRTFSILMSEELGEVDYNAKERLRYGANYPGKDQPSQIMLIDDEAAADPPKNVSFGAEELAIAQLVKKRLMKGEQVFDGEKMRSCIPEDFCLLTSGHDACRRMGEALSFVGLKAQSEQTEGYMRSREISIMTDLLRVIDNPMRDMPLAAVMLSPILRFTEQETAYIKLLCQSDDEPKRLWQTILSVSKDEDADEKEAAKITLDDKALEQKCRDAVKLIKRLRFYSVSLSLEALINKIYDETDFFSIAAAFEDPRQKRANLRLLTQRAAEYEKDRTGGVAGFLRFLESVTRSGGDFSQALATNSGSGCIAVKTIHSSKGLEYPFVILFGLSTSFNMKDTFGRLLLSEQLGAGINCMKHSKLLDMQTISHFAVKTAIRGENLSERLRLLYVALTRAKERLTIALYLKRTSKKNDMKKTLAALADEISLSGGASPAILLNCKSYTEWLSAAVMLSSNNKPLLEAVGRGELSEELSEISKRFDADMPETEYVFPEKNEDQTASAGRFVKAAPDPFMVDRLLKKYAFSYPNEVARAPSKRSVTEIVSELREREDGEADPMFYPQLGSLKEESERLSGAQRGTLTHLFMELADYTRAEKNVEEEISRLVVQGSFTKREADGIYVNALKKFFASDLYKRMKNSKELMREVKFMVRADDAGIADDETLGEMIAPDGMLQGICDCIFQEPDGYVIVDYKTDRFSNREELKKYSVQLKLYKAAMDLILPIPVKSCCIYSFALSEAEEIGN